MPSLVRCKPALRRLLAFTWIVALANVWVPELAARDSHAGPVDAPVPVARQPHHHPAPDGSSQGPTWASSPDHCDHCARGNGCHESPGCTSGCSALLSVAPTIAFEAVERLRDGWRPDRPLAENPTPPTPPPPSIL